MTVRGSFDLALKPGGRMPHKGKYKKSAGKKAAKKEKGEEMPMKGMPKKMPMRSRRVSV